MQKYPHIASLIYRRIAEMKASDKETGEHPNATEEEYIEWAIEECEQNGEITIELA